MIRLTAFLRRSRTGPRVRGAALVMALGLVPAVGCNSIKNAWLDPTVLGAFDRTATMEIRDSLTLEDTPFGIPGAVYPSPEDLTIRFEEYPITAGDTLAIEIYELRQRQIPFQAEVAVSSTGYVNLPVVGRVNASGLTVPEFEDSVVDALRSHDILREPEVTVNPMFLQTATYSIFGIGVSASNDAPLRAGTFPIRRADLRILEAINQVGGLNEFVTDVFVFRYDDPPWKRRRMSDLPAAPERIDEARSGPPSDEMEPSAGEPNAQIIEEGGRSPEQDLIDAILGDRDEIAQPDKGPSGPEPPAPSVPELLEPEPTHPFIYVNGEFVPNPAYRASPGDVPVSRAGPPTIDTVAPAVNWARIAGETSYRIIRIPADALRSGDPELDIVIRAGDVIRVVSGEIGVYYVMGQVNRVGAFAFNAEAITLKAAIAAAGGLSNLAWPDRCTVYRRIGQREQMIQVNLDRIFASRDPDFQIRRGDIINVGTHPFAPFLQRIRAWTLPNPASTVGYSFTYSRNFADIDSFAVRRNPHNEPDNFPALFP